MPGFLAVCLLLLLSFRTIYTAPSIEACPPDSVQVGDVCICDYDSCKKPPCPYDLEIVVNASDVPGSCCPIYSCQGCKNETLIEGKCPCAPGAVVNERGICACFDEERHLVNGECVCNPQQCELPQSCDRKSVSIVIEDGCCRKTRCQPCPEDSESTNLESNDLEDHCVCLPCINDCGFNKSVVVKKKGTGFPGNCCDLYECKPILDEKDKDCVVGDIIYASEEEWSTDDKQQCKCQNGLSLCSHKQDEVAPQICWDEGVMYRHNETWLRDHGCTNCTCVDGEQKCISHYCDFKESQINQNVSTPCFRRNKVYEHLQTWTEDDLCTTCTCLMGEEKCSSEACAYKETAKKGECQPLFDCTKQCPNGFKINKKGCEICKCNPSKVSQELLTKYNISMGDLINILENYKRDRTSTTPASTTTSTSTSTNTAASTTPMPTVLIIRRNGDDGSVSSTEAMITPAQYPEDDKFSWIIIAALAVLVVGTVVGTAGVCIYKNKRKHSMDITTSRGSYHSVSNSTMDNNNTIKKVSIRYNDD